MSESEWTFFQELQAHQTMFAATANNIANVNTQGYKPQQVNVAASPSGRR